ncbi:MAG: hypothetical protein ACE5IW_04300 [bacterium]
MKKQLVITACIVGMVMVGCAKKVPVYDEARKPITEQEIQKYQTNKNFTLYTVGGGALSFGASFFLGTLIKRGLDGSTGDAALWATTGTGTLIGTILFAGHGKNRDRNQAIEAIKEKRKKDAAKKLTEEKLRQQKLEDELKALETIRQQQEAEKKRLLEELEKRKNKPNNN